MHLLFFAWLTAAHRSCSIQDFLSLFAVFPSTAVSFEAYDLVHGTFHYASAPFADPFSLFLFSAADVIAFLSLRLARSSCPFWSFSAGYFVSIPMVFDCRTFSFPRSATAFVLAFSPAPSGCLDFPLRFFVFPFMTSGCSRPEVSRFAPLTARFRFAPGAAHSPRRCCVYPLFTISRQPPAPLPVPCSRSLDRLFASALFRPLLRAVWSSAATPSSLSVTAGSAVVRVLPDCPPDSRMVGCLSTFPTSCFPGVSAPLVFLHSFLKTHPPAFFSAVAPAHSRT